MSDIDDYDFQVGWCEEDRAFIGCVTEFRSLAAHGESTGTALAEIRIVVEMVVSDLAAADEPIPAPISAGTRGTA
jgi:predicted RNase H-like HicB family nuclease